jgi:hypothetical protein
MYARRKSLLHGASAPVSRPAPARVRKSGAAAPMRRACAAAGGQRLCAAFLRALRGAALVCLVLMCDSLVVARAEEAPTLEQRVKAAYLFKFTDYVTWPDGTFTRPESPLVFGVVDDDQVAGELAQTAIGHTVAGHPVVIRRLKPGESTAGINILFVAGASRVRLEQTVKAAGTQPLLIITEAEGALDRGSAINFVLVGDHVKFEIALDSVEKRGLKLSSRLLSVAQNVRSGAESR